MNIQLLQFLLWNRVRSVRCPVDGIGPAHSLRRGATGAAPVECSATRATGLVRQASDVDAQGLSCARTSRLTAYRSGVYQAGAGASGDCASQPRGCSHRLWRRETPVRVPGQRGEWAGSQARPTGVGGLGWGGAGRRKPGRRRCHLSRQQLGERHAARQYPVPSTALVNRMRIPLRDWVVNGTEPPPSVWPHMLGANGQRTLVAPTPDEFNATGVPIYAPLPIHGCRVHNHAAAGRRGRLGSSRQSGDRRQRPAMRLAKHRAGLVVPFSPTGCSGRTHKGGVA